MVSACNSNSPVSYNSDSDSDNDQFSAPPSNPSRITSAAYLRLIGQALNQKDGGQQFSQLLQGRPQLSKESYQKLPKIVPLAQFNALGILMASQHYSQMNATQREELHRRVASKQKLRARVAEAKSSASSNPVNVPQLKAIASVQKAVGSVLPARTPSPIEQLLDPKMPDLGAQVRRNPSPPAAPQ